MRSNQAPLISEGRKMEVADREREDLWMESVRRYNARRREESRQAWQRVPPGTGRPPEEHRGPADRLPRERGGETVRGRSLVSGRNAELRARGVAALLCGERPAVVARDLGVPEESVRSGPPDLRDP